MMLRIKLKRCPFCGGEAKLVDNYPEYRYIMCKDCECQTPVIQAGADYSAAGKALSLWQRRTPPGLEW